MTCEICEGNGWIHTGTVDGSDLPGKQYSSCSECTTTCTICKDTGYEKQMFESDGLVDRLCPACWSWGACSLCLGTGKYEDGVIVVCESCSGIGYVIKGWAGNGLPPEIDTDGYGHESYSIDSETA